VRWKGSSNRRTGSDPIRGSNKDGSIARNLTRFQSHPLPIPPAPLFASNLAAHVRIAGVPACLFFLRHFFRGTPQTWSEQAIDRRATHEI
jgi:hypothetical protein